MSQSIEMGGDISHAASLITKGELVAIPTETVYGLAANAFDPIAVAQIFEAKKRPHFDPLIVHIASIKMLNQVAVEVPEIASRLIEKFWPGPLTIVLPKTNRVPDLVTSGLKSVAIRMPSHPLAIRLIEEANTPLAAPSANLFGRTSPTTAAHVADQLKEKLSYILDGGACEVGIESTIVSFSEDRALLLRPGGITVEQIEKVLGAGTVLFPEAEAASESYPLAPGQLKEHYAPMTPLVIVEKMNRPAGVKRVGLLTFQKPGSLPKFEAIEELSSTGNLVEAAANFFAAIRRLDEKNLDLIIATTFPSHGLGLALNDRLSRASHQ